VGIGENPRTFEGAGVGLVTVETTDVVDAIVVAEALAAAPAVILTSDRPEPGGLLDGEPGSPFVAVVEV
jgi:hypothetical protein